MKSFIKIMSCLLPLVLSSGCAVGSATAGYALKAQTAEQLTSDGEQKVVERAKSEMRVELAK